MTFAAVGSFIFFLGEIEGRIDFIMAPALLAEEIENAAMRLSWIAFGDFAISRVAGLLAAKRVDWKADRNCKDGK